MNFKFNTGAERIAVLEISSFIPCSPNLHHPVHYQLSNASKTLIFLSGLAGLDGPRVLVPLSVEMDTSVSEIMSCQEFVEVAVRKGFDVKNLRHGLLEERV